MDAPDPHWTETTQVLARYTVEKLREPRTYVLVFLVGSFINLYGHFLVPYLRGHHNPMLRFLEEVSAFPGTVGLSVAIGYAFPLFVSTYSSVVTRYGNRIYEAKAQFPDAKPDPVFRCTEDGTIVAAGRVTEELLTRHGLESAQDVVGAEVWTRIVALQQQDEGLPPDTMVHVVPLGARFLVAHSAGPRGTINVYLTRTLAVVSEGAA